ncbi:MAG: bifunctional folylpolyglutamate synthase/dihydrofolate synthase [Bacteroidales bacterium]|nr:bifunctional folylpolyglutamate synthase/dihydrofolate synthase [Bacteroidales bacterium]
MQYEKKIEEIFERHPSVQVSGFNGRAYKSGIEGMIAFDNVLGQPWKAFRCIHVAGTNGKGSVSSMIAASLASCGLRVGLYTSPHLLDFRERIKLIPNELISKEEVLEFLERYEKEIESLSFFEITTGMAFWWFAREGVDVAVIEVGLGGRLDSTNVITPELSVVTSIGLDHCSMLGDTRAEIALEKAGIFKPGIPALVWGHDPETDKVFMDYASKVGAELHFADEIIEPVHLEGMDLRGEYQDLNVRTTLAALKLLKVEPDLEALRLTARITGLRGRWEILRENPTVICDIGHNPPALEWNFRQLEQSGRPLIIVYGIMADKALDDIAPLMPARARYILCAPDSARALPVQALFERLSALRPDLSLQTAPSVRGALDHALSLASPDTLIYVGGSTFVVAEIIK